MNESHGLPLAFNLYKKHKDVKEVKKRLVFTNHTPEAAGNAKTDLVLLDKIGFFCDVPQTEVRDITQIGDHELDHTLTAISLSGKANGVSAMHRETMFRMWEEIGTFVKSLRSPMHKILHIGMMMIYMMH